MKYGDKVKVIKDKAEYEQEGVFSGEIGEIWFAEIRDNSFFVYFDADYKGHNYKTCDIKIEDLELVEDGEITDDEILNGLPTPDPRWWCKVENGYIMNLLGEKKNKIPYDYNS